MLASQIQKHRRKKVKKKKKTIYHDKVQFNPGSKVGLKFRNQLVQYTISIEKKKNVTILIDARKAFSKIQHTFMIKTLNKHM